MSVIDETALIELVRKYPLLYDLSSPLYIDQIKKEEAWQEISIQMSASAYDCKTKWTRLRDNYRKALITRNKNSNRSKDRAVKYEKQLSFLNEKFSFTPRKRNILIYEPEKKEPEVKILAVKQPGTFVTQSAHTPNKVPKKEMIGTKPVHEVNVFFEGIAETVKTFPKKIQIQIKRAIFNMVNDTEATLLDGNDSIEYHPMNSPTLGTSHPETNRIIDSPDHQVTTLNDFVTDTMNSLVTTDTMSENLYDIDIKEEDIC